MALGVPPTGQVRPFITGKTTCDGRTSVPSASFGTSLSGGATLRTTQSSMSMKSARKVSAKSMLLPAG